MSWEYSVTNVYNGFSVVKDYRVASHWTIQMNMGSDHARKAKCDHDHTKSG